MLALELPGRLMDDFVYWKFSRDGRFFVKSAYAMLYAQQSAQFALAGGSFPPGGWRKFWGLSVLPKWKLFVWKLLSRGIPVGEVLVRRGIPVFSGCLFCGQTEESLIYIVIVFMSNLFGWEVPLAALCLRLLGHFKTGAWVVC